MMILDIPIIKKITLDTNKDLLGEASNLYVEIINETTGMSSVSTPEFSEIQFNGQNTGIYIADLEFYETGQFSIFIKHNILDKSGYVSVVISTQKTYSDLENKMIEVGNEAEQVEESSSFA